MQENISVLRKVSEHSSDQNIFYPYEQQSFFIEPPKGKQPFTRLFRQETSTSTRKDLGMGIGSNGAMEKKKYTSEVYYGAVEKGALTYLNQTLLPPGFFRPKKKRTVRI